MSGTVTSKEGAATAQGSEKSTRTSSNASICQLAATSIEGVASDQGSEKSIVLGRPAAEVSTDWLYCGIPEPATPYKVPPLLRVPRSLQGLPAAQVSSDWLYCGVWTQKLP